MQARLHRRRRNLAELKAGCSKPAGSGSDILRETVRLLEAGRRRGYRGITDIICAAGDFVEACIVTHAISDRMIGAGAIAADAQTSDDLATLIESDASAEGDDATRELVCARVWSKEIRVERVGIVEAVKRASGLRVRLAVERANFELLKSLAVLAFAIAMARLPGHASPVLMTEQSLP